VTPLGPGEMRARNRPGVVLGIATLRLVCGFVLAVPLSSMIGQGGVGQLPQGDRALFEGGGYLLLELLRVQGAELAAVARGLLPVFGLGLLLTLACNAALLVALNVRGRLELGAWLGRSLPRVPAFVLLACAVGLVQLVLWISGVLAVGALPAPQHLPRLTTAGQLACLLLVALLAGAAGGFGDVAKAALVRYETTLTSGVSHAFRCWRRRPFATSFGWLPFSGVFGLAALAAAHLTERLDVSRAGDWRLLAVFGVHQLVIALSVLLRAAWFARALRLAGST
jgi:hypothetical protein